VNRTENFLVFKIMFIKKPLGFEMLMRTFDVSEIQFYEPWMCISLCIKPA